MKLLIVFCLSFFLNEAKSQILDKPLNNYKKFIWQKFNSYGEIDDTSKKFSDIENLIYSRELNKPAKDIKIRYFEIGLTVSHGYKYVGILSKGKLSILPSRNFANEYDSIKIPLQKLNIDFRGRRYISFLRDIKNIYNYNFAPPWKRTITARNE